MLKSAENWMAGFFGLEWCALDQCNSQVLMLISHRPRNATIEVIIEQKGFNNSLAGSLNCPNANAKSSGNEAVNTWIHEYLKEGKALSLTIYSQTCRPDARCSPDTIPVNDRRVYMDY